MRTQFAGVGLTKRQKTRKRLVRIDSCSDEELQDGRKRREGQPQVLFASETQTFIYTTE